MSNYVNKVIKDDVEYDINDARILPLPDPELNDIIEGTTTSSIYIDTSKIPNWDYFTVSNAVFAEFRSDPNTIDFETSEPQNPEESGKFWWKDGDVFKVYNTETESWEVFTPTMVNNTTYIFCMRYYNIPNEGEERGIGDAYLNGESVSDTSSQSSEPDPTSYSIWYNTDSDQFYKSSNGIWEYLDESNYIRYDETTSSGYVYFTTNDSLMYIGSSFYGAFAASSDQEEGMIGYASYDFTSESPQTGELKYLFIGAECFEDIEPEGMLIANKNFSEYGIVANTWSITTGEYPLDSSTTYNYVSDHFNDAINDCIQVVTVPVIEGQYYKEKDIEEDAQYIENGSTSNSITFNININPDFTQMENPDRMIYAIGETDDRPTFAVYHNNVWEDITISDDYWIEYGEGELPTQGVDEGTYGFIYGVDEEETIIQNLYVFTSGNWVQKDYTFTEPVSPSEGDIYCVDGYIPIAISDFCSASFTYEGHSAVMYLQAISYSMTMEGEFIKDNMLVLSSIHVETFADFMSVMNSGGETMALYMMAEHRGEQQGGWYNGQEEGFDENGVLSIPVMLTFNDVAHTDILNTLAFLKYTPASIGKIVKIVDGQPLPLITSADIVSGALYLKLHTNRLSWSSDSNIAPFTYRGHGYLYKGDKGDYEIDLDPDKTYSFEVINSDPVWFANYGFSLVSAEIESNGNQIEFIAYALQNPAYSSRTLTIKIEEVQI